MSYSHSFLVIRLSSMGDVLLVTPFLRQLRAAYPHARIDVVVEARFAEVLRYNPHCTTIIEYTRTGSSNDLAALKTSLRSTLPGGRYDFVVDLQRNRHSRRIRAGMGRHVYRIYKARREKLSLVYLKKNLYRTIVPIAERYRLTVQELRVDDDGEGLELWLPEEAGARTYPPAVRTQEHRKRIAVAPGAFHATKRWLPERFAEAATVLARETGADVLLLGGAADRDICATVAAHIPSDIHVTDASGSTSVADTARLLDTSDVLLTNDTGVMHIAAARRIPVVSVFGSTVREFGFAPYRVTSRIVEVELGCRPCTHIGRAECPKGHFHCMRLIEAGQVVQAAREILAETAAR
jgi:lipopolysaccharide heptosyltransferase II